MLKLHKAIAFAAEFEKEQFLHGVEVMQILTAMSADEELQIAGLFFGAAKSSEEAALKIRERFGERVCDLALNPGAVDDVELGDPEIQLLIMADCVANLRRLICEHEQCGDSMWMYCRTSKDLQSWYYSEVQDLLCDMMDDEKTRDIYWEFVNLYKDLFVTYYLNDGEGILYQIAHGLSGYSLTREEPVWYPIGDRVPENAEVISREEAESLEELWNFKKEELYHDETLEGNERIEESILRFRKNQDKESLEYLAEVMGQRMMERGHVIMPIEHGIEEGHIAPRTITTDEGEVVIPAFTSHGEMKKGPYSEMLSIRIDHLFGVAKELEFVGGIVINPWGEFMYVGKDLISIIEDQVELPEEEDDDGELNVKFVEIPKDPTLLN